MPTLGSEILQYQGNANIGVGSGSAVVGAGDNNVINQTGRDLMMINHENNVLKYKQKQADREKELAAIASGQVQTGEVLPQDRKVIDDEQKKANDAYFKMVSISDKGSDAYKKAAIDYQAQLKSTNDAATWAQNRYVGRKKLEQEKSGLTLKEDQDKFQQHLDNEDKKSFYSGSYDPYQKSLDYDAEKIITDGWDGVNPTPSSTVNKQTVKTAPDGKQTVTDTKTTAPVKGAKGATAAVPTSEDVNTTIVKKPDGKVYQVTESKIDFDSIRRNQLAKYAEGGAGTENQMMHLKAIQSLPDAQYEDYANHILKRTADYDNDKGLEPGDPDYRDVKVLASKLGIDDTTGKKIPGSKIMLSTPDFAAYTALAGYNGSYAPKSETFLKDESEFDLKSGESKAKVRAINALANERNSKAALTNKKGKIIDNQFNPAQTFDELFKGKIQTVETGNGTKLPRVNVSDMPKSFLDNLGIDPINSKGDYNVVPSNIKFKGKDIPQNDALKMYNDWLKTPDAKSLQKKIGKDPDIFDFVYSYGGDFEVEVIGKTKPVYKIDKDGKKVEVEKGGQIIRSNRLQSWINQRKQEGIKGDKLLMEQPAAEDGTDTNE